jgi:RNA recognition motif-containing protein
MNIYAGNLSSDVLEKDLRQAFEAVGQVSSVRIVKDKYSGQPLRAIWRQSFAEFTLSEIE